MSWPRAKFKFAGARPSYEKFADTNVKNDVPFRFSDAASAGTAAAQDKELRVGYQPNPIQDASIAMMEKWGAKNGVKIDFSVPKEGAQFSIDMLGIPKDAPHPDNALKFIDYLNR